MLTCRHFILKSSEIVIVIFPFSICVLGVVDSRNFIDLVGRNTKFFSVYVMFLAVGRRFDKFRCVFSVGVSSYKVRFYCGVIKTVR